MKHLWLWPLLAVSLPAQNSDLSLLLGYTSSEFQVGNLVSDQHQVTLQFNYAYQVRDNGPHRLYVEFPIAPVGDNAVRVNQNVVVKAANRFFFTPGVRYQYGLSPRVSVYTAAGFGVGTYRRNEFVLSSNFVNTYTNRSASAAWDAAVGLDFRWTRLVSVRGELRNFGRFTGPAERNTLRFAAGLALHF